jgi:hypothetical protein
MLWSLLLSVCYSFGIYAHYNAQRGFNRFFVGCLLFYGLNFNAAYHSFLLSVLTRPRYEHQVSNIHEAVAADYEFAGGENLKAFFEGKDAVAAHLRENYISCFDMDKCLLEIKENGRLAVAISRQHAMNAIRVPITDLDMYCFEKTDNIFSFSVVMLFKKDHHLLPLVNRLIRRISESGFILKWRADTEFYKLKETIERQRNDDSSSNRAINVGQLMGLFALGGVGLSVATIGFAFEWVVYYFAHHKKLKILRSIFAKIEKNFMFVKK